MSKKVLNINDLMFKFKYFKEVFCQSQSVTTDLLILL